MKLGIAVIVCIIAISALAVPAMADYTADKPLTVYEHEDVDNGGLTYTVGDSYYSGKLMNDHDGDPLTDDADHYIVTLIPDMPAEAEVESARLYIYWTWSAVDTDLYDNRGPWDQGVNAQFEVKFNEEIVPLDRAYSDSKGYGSYNYPGGTYCYDVTDLVIGTNVADAKNSYPYTGDDPATAGNDDQYACIQGIGLVVVYEIENADDDDDDDEEEYTLEYWIAEGSDMTYCDWTGYEWRYGITPDDTITPVTFSDVETELLENAVLTTVVPAGDSSNNRLYFNDHPWDGLWNCNPYCDLSWTLTDVTDYMVEGDNIAKFQNGRYEPNGGDRMMAASNAFLAIKYRENE